MPIKARAGISLAPGCDVAVADYRLDRKAMMQVGEQAVESLVLCVGKRQLVTTLELNAD